MQTTLLVVRTKATQRGLHRPQHQKTRNVLELIYYSTIFRTQN